MQQFHKTDKWKNKRKRILRRDEYRCQECKRYGKSEEATTVHHIHPVEQRPDLALTNENLISLCNNHHEKMHDRVNNELTGLGREWAKRIERLIPPLPSS